MLRVCGEDLPASSPACVNQPGSGAMLLHLLGQHAGILHGMPHQEGSPKAGAEGCLRLSHTLLGAGNLHSSVSIIMYNDAECFQVQESWGT